MKKTNIVFVLSIFLISLVLASCSTETKVETYHVGLLSGAGLFDTTFDGFKEGMTNLGYIEGDNIVYDFQQANGDPAEMQRISEQFVADDVDLIVTTTNNAAIAARDAVDGTDIPVVFTFVIGPVVTGVVDNLKTPDNNITGIRNPLDIFVDKRVNLFLQMDPDATQIWVPYNPTYPTVTAVLEQLRIESKNQGLELIESEVATPEDVIALIEEFKTVGEVSFDAVIIFPDLTVQQPEAWSAILEYANENNLPILANSPGQVQDGAIFSYLTDNIKTGTQAARIAHQIFQGVSVEEIPVETAELFLMLNLKSSEALGLNVSDQVLSQATTILRDE